jgi:hypothetical protein
MTMSAAGVVSIAFAKTGFVLLSTIPSEMLPPSNGDLIEMLEDDLAYLAPQTRGAVVFELSTISKRSRCSQYLHSASPFTACTALVHCPCSE